MPWGTSVKADAQRWEGLRFQPAATMACLSSLLDVCCEGFVFPKTIHQNQENARHVCFTQKNFAIQMLQSMVFCFKKLWSDVLLNVLHQFQTQPTCWVCLAFTMCQSYLFLRAAVFRWAPVVQWASQGNGAHQNSWGSLIPPTGWPWRFVFPVKRRIHEARGRLDQSGICPILGAWWTPFWNILDALLGKHGLRFPLIMAIGCESHLTRLDRCLVYSQLMPNQPLPGCAKILQWADLHNSVILGEDLLGRKARRSWGLEWGQEGSV